MFRNAIEQTPLTTRFAEEYFHGKIYGDSVGRDQTFISTLRALVTPRMNDGDIIYFSYDARNPTAGSARSKTEENLARDILCSMDSIRNTICLRNYSGMQEVVDKYLNAIENNIGTILPAYQRITKVTDFYRKVFRVLCYINPETKSVLIFTDNMDNRRMHYLQCGIFAFLPWYFDPSQGISADGMELINSLREKTSEKYEACLKKIAEQYDFRSAGIKSMLSGFELRFEKTRKREIEHDITSILDSIESYNREIGSLLRRKRDLDAHLCGIAEKLASGENDDEIMHYFINNKKLTLSSVDGLAMEFVVKDYLEYFDEDEAVSAIGNKRSFVYRWNDGVFSDSDIKLLMNAVFVDQIIKIKFCAAYTFRIDGNVEGIRHYAYDGDCNDCMPNPHIDQYRCLGAYQAEINMFLQDHNYIGAIEQCIASCKSLNFADWTVMNEFMQRVCGNSDSSVNNKCFELPDGSVVNTKAAIEFLKKQKGEESVNG